MNYPTELQLLEFFGVEPVSDDGISTFTISDAGGVELSLSFNVLDDSLQTSLRLMGRLIALVCHEGMTRLWIEDDVLFAEFFHDPFKICATVKTNPYIDIQWNGLRTK